MTGGAVRPERIDAHHHFWDLASGRYDWPTAAEHPIFRSFGPGDLEPELGAAGIDRTIIVQTTDSLEDTDSMLEVASSRRWVAGVVGWVPLEDPERMATELAARAGRLCGIRHLIHREADPGWLLRSSVQRGLAMLAELGLPFDVVAVFPDHLRLLPEVAARHPDLVLVVDHLAKPPFRAPGWDAWVDDLRAAAEVPTIHAKVSGLDTAAGPDWSVQELRPAFEVALEAFGPSRLLFGSDWPVCRLVSSYAAVVEATRALVSGLSDAERDAILGGTATRVYGLAAAAPA